jgi:large conductance mechanosensitive channel
MSLASEFKEFAMKGNVIDLAVGVVIGAAFGKIVTSLVADLIMPPLGLAIGGINFTDLAVAIGADPTGKAVLFKYGAFIQTVFEFLLIAFALFLLVKGINRLKRPPPPSSPAAPPPTATEQLLIEIRDLLAKQR